MTTTKLKSDFRKEISYYKDKELKLAKRLAREESKVDDNFSKIENYVNKNRELDVEQLVEIIISKCWVSKDNLTKQQLYLSTKSLIEDFLVIEAIEDSVEAI